MAADLKIFLTLCFIGSIGFEDHFTESSLASVLFASASLGGGWSAGAYQQIVKNMQKNFIPFKRDGISKNSKSQISKIKQFPMTEIQNPKRVWKIGYCKFDIYLSFGACNLVFFCFITPRPIADHGFIATLCKLNV